MCGKIKLITQLRAHWVVMEIEQMYQAFLSPKYTEDNCSEIPPPPKDRHPQGWANRTGNNPGPEVAKLVDSALG